MKGSTHRRSLSRAGYESLKSAQVDLGHVRALLALADADDTEGLAWLDIGWRASGGDRAP